MFQKCITFLICICGSHKSDIHTEQLRDIINVDFREDNLLSNTKCVIATTVELALNTLEVTDTRQSHTD